MGKKKEVLKEKRRFSNKQLAMVSIIFVSIIVLGSVLSFLLLQNPTKFSLNAAIIDQLGKECKNQEFVDNVTNILEAAGFNVTYHESKNVNVNFFKGLAKYNYGITILRTHSALRENKSIVDFFTSEEYVGNKYVEEQENGLLTKGNYLWEPNKFYFAITPKFIESLEGRFPKSVIIAMGCWSLKQECEEMADAFIRKGAEVYIGWTEAVGLGHTDNETIKLLRMLLKENKTIEEAVGRTSRDWRYFSEMRYHPKSAGNITISSLIAEAKASLNHQDGITFFNPFSVICVTNFISVEIRKESRFGLC